MKTYFEELEEKKNKCKTIGDWKAFAEELMEELISSNDYNLAMQAIIKEEYGTNILEQIEEKTEELMENSLPLNIAAFLFGYQKEEICVISQKIATDLYEDGREIWLLNENNTEKLAFEIEQIKNHQGMFGITFAELDKIAKETPNNQERE